MYNFIIGKLVSAKNPKHKYKFILNFMHGDADGNSSEEVIIDPSNKWIDYFIDFLESVLKAYPNGMGGDDKYNHYNTNYSYLFLENELEDLEQKEIEEELNSKELQLLKEYDNSISVYFPNDNPYTYGHATLVGYTIRYYDFEGLEYYITIKKQ